MGFQEPTPVAKILDRIHSHDYVLPAIQREFVWSTDQIRALFDSLLRGYPIGSFLFWDVAPEQSGHYTFYDFLTHYHEKDHPYAMPIAIPVGKRVTAILDGQQRLTALNIGLYGSHTERLARKWANNPDAYPKKHLYINLMEPPAENDLGLAYDLRFLRDVDAAPQPGTPHKWFRVADVLRLEDAGPAINDELEDRRLAGKRPYHVLYDLFRAVREARVINAYQEETQDPNKVLDIFVRVNSGGTELSYSDLLLSMATNQWKERDAREEVRSLVQELNNTSAQFSFTKDQVLKAGLMLTDVPDVGFKVTNFTQHNMAKMENDWDRIRTSVLVAADLLATYGFAGRTLTAHSVLLPVAYYIHHCGLDSAYVTSSRHASDRLALQQWVMRSLMKRGIWGSGLDTLLARLREAIRSAGKDHFPVSEVEVSMNALGKSLRFDTAEIDELMELHFGSGRLFPVLAALYPGLDLTKSFHEDHIFPRSRFTAARLVKAGIAPDELPEFLTRVDALPNLQLLAGLPNTEKQDRWPWEWLDGPHFASAAARHTYIAENDLQDLPTSLDGFPKFYAARRARMAERLADLLGIT